MPPERLPYERRNQQQVLHIADVMFNWRSYERGKEGREDFWYLWHPVLRYLKSSKISSLAPTIFHHSPTVCLHYSICWRIYRIRSHYTTKVRLQDMPLVSVCSSALGHDRLRPLCWEHVPLWYGNFTYKLLAQISHVLHAIFNDSTGE